MNFNAEDYRNALDTLELELLSHLNDFLLDTKGVDILEKLLDKYVYGTTEGLNENVMSDLPLVEIKSTITGNVFDYYVISIDEYGTLICIEPSNEALDKALRKVPTHLTTISFEYLNSIQDRINLLEFLITLCDEQ